MEKLSHTSSKVKRSSWDKTYGSYLAAATDRKIRNIISKRRPGSFLDTSYAKSSGEKIFVSDSFEVSSQLSILKTLMDKERFSFTRGDMRLTRLKSEGVKIDQVTTQRKSSVENLNNKIQFIQDTIDYTLESQLNEETNSAINAHLLDRMRTTLVFLRRKYKKLERELHIKSFELNSISQKSNKSKESKINTLIVFSNFKESVNFETNTKRDELEKIEKDLRKRKELSEKRLAHKIKQAEIMEKAIIEDQSVELEELKEKYLLHFMWSMASGLRFEKEQIKWKKYEDAFLKIKIATGIQDIPTLVEKYLTKEQIYSDFLGSVKKKEVELVVYQDKIDNIQRNLDKLNKMGLESLIKIEKSTYDLLHETRKKAIEENLKMKQLSIIQNKIKNWCIKFNAKLHRITGTDTVDLSDKSILESMNQVKVNTKIALKSFRVDLVKSKTFYNTIKKQNIETIITNIPSDTRLKGKITDKIELSELTYVEANNEDQNRRNR
jgi:hypothetical protein